MDFIVIKKYWEQTQANTVYLTKNSWNDWWEYETLFSVNYVNEAHKSIYLGDVKIGEEEMPDGVKTPQIPPKFTKLSTKFFSLGQSDYYYEEVYKLGPTIAKQILEGLRDIAYYKSVYEGVLGLDITKKSLMRDVGSYTIENQYRRLARGGARLTSYNFSYEYPEIDSEITSPVLEFNVNPNSFPPTNIQVIIGRNGVGKSYLMKNIVSAFSIPTNKSYGKLISEDKELKRISDINKEFPNLVCIAFSPFDTFVRKISSKSVKYDYIGLEVDAETEEGKSNVKSSEERQNDNFCNSLKICISNEQKCNLLTNAIETLSSDPIFSECQIRELFINNDNVESKIEWEDVSKTAIKIFKKLSSGHKVILLTVTRLISIVTEKSLILIDEPENHLHPPLLSAFIRALSDLLIDRNAVAIIATHSPVVLQEVPKKCVWKINRHGKYVTAERPNYETFANTIGVLTSEVFGLEVNKSGFHKMILDEVNAGLTFSEIKEKFNNEIGIEGLALISTLLANKDSSNE